MLRSGCHYRASTNTNVSPDAEDIGDRLDKKWRHWVEEESWKRYQSQLSRTTAHSG
jgi:hypothetical protein